MNALIQAIPAIFNVLLVCLVFWLLFSIMGVSLFSGRFSSCVDSNGQMIDTSVVANKSACLELLHLNYTWFTPNVTFDNVFSAYLALLQVVAFAFCCRYISVVFSLVLLLYCCFNALEALEATNARTGFVVVPYLVDAATLRVGRRTSDREVVGLTMLCNNLRQVVHILVPLSPSSISWYRCKNREGNGILWKRYGVD